MTEAIERRQALAALWRWSSEQFPSSPLYGSLSRWVAEDPEVLDLVLEAPPEAHLPLVLLAAVHFLILGGLEHPLADVYAGAGGADPGVLFHDLCLGRRQDLLEVMATRRIQTNEVGRSALVGPALTLVRETCDAPLHVVDVGTSAGIVLCCDRFFLDYGAHGATGPSHSPVRIECEVRAGRPTIARVLGPFASRSGIDRDPPDLGDPEQVRWLLACIWPDSGRLERARLAIEEVEKDPPPIRRGEALELLPEVLDDLQDLDDGGVVCVLTTWSFGYLSIDGRAEFCRMLSARGRRRPVVWVCGDGPGVVQMVTAQADPDQGEVLSAVTFDSDGAHPQLLARVHPHGSWIDWRA